MVRRARKPSTLEACGPTVISVRSVISLRLIRFPLSIGFRIFKQLRNVSVSAFFCNYHCCSTMLILLVWVSSVGEQELHYFDLALTCCRCERGHAKLVFNIDICAASNQGFHNLVVAVPCGEDQGS